MNQSTGDAIDVGGTSDTRAVTYPVNTDALRRLAVWLVGINVTHGPMLGVGHIATAADEVDRLRTVIENAPHAGDCIIGRRGQWRIPCTCWKASAL